MSEIGENQEKMVPVLVPESLAGEVSELCSHYLASVDSGLCLAVTLPMFGNRPAIAVYEIDTDEWHLAYGSGSLNK